mgnify:FL=1
MPFFGDNVMKIGIFGKKYDDAYTCHLQLLVTTLEEKGVDIVVPESYYALIVSCMQFTRKPYVVEGDYLRRNDVDYLFSIGGDGTLLASVRLVAEVGAV